MRIFESATNKQARIDSGEDIVVGVNKYRLSTPDEVPVRSVDNAAVRAQQISRLNEMKSSRDSKHRMQYL